MAKKWWIMRVMWCVSKQVPWEKFDEKAYIDKKRVRVGEDAYARNKFNQQASDDISSNRAVPDTRHMQWVIALYVCPSICPSICCWLADCVPLSIYPYVSVCLFMPVSIHHYLAICLLICLSACVHPPIYPSMCLSACLSMHLAIQLSSCLSTWMPVCVHPPIHPSIRVCLPACLYLFPPISLAVCLAGSSFCMNFGLGYLLNRWEISTQKKREKIKCYWFIFVYFDLIGDFSQIIYGVMCVSFIIYASVSTLGVFEESFQGLYWPDVLVFLAYGGTWHCEHTLFLCGNC